jgi:hypothetical protein
MIDEAVPIKLPPSPHLRCPLHRNPHGGNLKLHLDKKQSAFQPGHACGSAGIMTLYDHASGSNVLQLLKLIFSCPFSEQVNTVSLENGISATGFVPEAMRVAVSSKRFTREQRVLFQKHHELSFHQGI